MLEYTIKNFLFSFTFYVAIKKCKIALSLHLWLALYFCWIVLYQRAVGASRVSLCISINFSLTLSVSVITSSLIFFLSKMFEMFLRDF